MHLHGKNTNDQNGGNLINCPVMKFEQVDKNKAERVGLVREYKGRKYYFCCETCLSAFDNNLEEHAK